jgi:tetratricopeptide (TPR) repeat protein
MITKLPWVPIVLTITSSMWIVQAQDDGLGAINRGNQMVAQAKYEAAIREYERVSPTANRYAQALYNLGVCHYELWQTERAVDFYLRAIAISKNNYPKASYALGVALEDLGRITEASEAYRQSIDASGGNFAPAQFRLGLIKASSGDNRSAERLFREAVKHPGDHLPASHNNLGVILAWTGRLKEAKQEFKTALRQSGGTFELAAQNMKLCQDLLTGQATKIALFNVSASERVLFTNAIRRPLIN